MQLIFLPFKFDVILISHPMLDAFVIAVKEDQTEQGKEGESIKASAVRGISASVLVGKAWQWEGLCLWNVCPTYRLTMLLRMTLHKFPRLHLESQTNTTMPESCRATQSLTHVQ